MSNIPLESGRILVVDDEEGVRNLIEDLMRQAGHTVFAAESVIKAMRITRRERLDLVITDLVMPYSPGYVLVGALYRNPKTYALPILAISADGDLVLSHQGDERGLHSLSSNIAAYIDKPFSIYELQGTVMAILHAARSGRFHPGEPYYKALGSRKRPPRRRKASGPPKGDEG